MGKGRIEVVEVIRGQNSAEGKVKFSVSENCGTPIANF